MTINNVIRINENILRYLIKETVHDYIKAITSYGGDKYDDYEQFFTTENDQEFKQWLNEQPKLNGELRYIEVIHLISNILRFAFLRLVR